MFRSDRSPPGSGGARNQGSGPAWRALLAGCLLLVGPAAAHSDSSPTPPEKPAATAAGASVADRDDPPKIAPETPDKTTATVKVEADLDCMVTIGLQPPQILRTGETLTVEVDPGALRVQATSLLAPEAKTFEDINLEPGGRQRVRLKMAKALADLRKLEARDRTYRDIETRLMWPNRDNGADLDWQSAVGFCDKFEHGGWKDWRLPTLDELETIENMWSWRPYKTVDPITLSSCCPWSSDLIDEENAWNFDYRSRRPFRGHLRYSLSLRALCVRDGSSEIPENTRKNRRLAKKEAKEKRREKLRRQAARAAAEEEAAAQKEGDDGSGPDGGP